MTSFEPGSLTRVSSRTILLADKSSVIAEMEGRVALEFEEAKIVLENVLLIPSLGYILVSVGRLVDKGIESNFSTHKVSLQYGRFSVEVASGQRDPETGLYRLLYKEKDGPITLAAHEKRDTVLWHGRLGHMNQKDLSRLFKYADGVPQLKPTTDVSRACRMAKAHKLPFKGKFTRATKVGDVIHSDIVGPLEPTFPDRYRYFVTFQDDHSRYDFIGLMKRKSDLIIVFNAFLARFSQLTSTTAKSLTVHEELYSMYSTMIGNIKRIHSDGGMEYVHLENEVGDLVEKIYSIPHLIRLN